MGVGVRDRPFSCEEHSLAALRTPCPWSWRHLVHATAKASPATFYSLCRKTANVLPRTPRLPWRMCPFCVVGGSVLGLRWGMTHQAAVCRVLSSQAPAPPGELRAGELGLQSVPSVRELSTLQSVG